jgi:hypothetical protein
MSYVIATTGPYVKWYRFSFGSSEYEILETLDLTQVTIFGDKASAKEAALETGLKTWRYVKI